MKRLLIAFVMLSGIAVLAGPPGPGPGPGPRGPHGGPPPPHHHHGSDGLHDAAAITTIVANGVKIAGELNRANQPNQTTVVVPAQTTVVTAPAPTTVVTVPATTTTTTTTTVVKH